MPEKKKKLLVVEDDFFLIKIFQAKLTHEGFEVQVASDGELALEILKTFIPDMILLDLVMPKKDGFEMLKDLNANKKLKDIPFIVLTNLGQETDIERVKKFGIIDYLVKADTPIQQVVDRIKKALQ